MTTLSICNCLHGLIKVIEVLSSGFSQQMLLAFFAYYLFDPKIFNRTQIWQVPAPTFEQFNAMALIPLREE